jgi:hypothetical protein
MRFDFCDLTRRHLPDMFTRFLVPLMR